MRPKETGDLVVLRSQFIGLLIFYSFITSKLIANKVSDVELFRNIFRSYAMSSYPDSEIRKMVLFPSSSMTSPLDPTAAFKSLQEKEYVLSKDLPSDLYLNSLMDDFESQKNPLDHKEPITIIVLPGVLGEFIDSSPFEKIFSSKSRFKSKVERLFKKEKEPVYFLSSMNSQQIKFTRLVRTGSIDDVLARPMVKLIYLKPMFASLESMGDLHENNLIYENRLEKLFAKIGTPKNLYILGYSQGATVALEFVRHISKDSRPNWAAKLKGLISLAGVLHGSAIAEKASTPGSPAFKLAESAKKLLNLKESSALEDIKFNMNLWKKFISETKELIPDTPEAKERKDINLSLFWTVKTAAKAIHNLGLGNPLFAYSDNIKRFKILINQALGSLYALTYGSRMDWWRNNTIPTDIAYFSINGVMGDKRYDSKENAPSWTRYQGEELSDYGILLRPNFHEILGFNGLQLNDSQISVHRSMFWPELHQELNPEQEIFKNYYMGVLGTHHWGLSFPYAMEGRKKRVNPFPRVILLKSIAAFVKIKQEAEK